MTETTIAVYRTDDPAYLDSFGGMLPVTVLEVVIPGDGWQVAPPSGEIRVKMNVTRAGYRKSEIIISSAHNIVPRSQVIHREYSDRVISLYRWE